MPTLNQLSSTSDVSAADQIPIYSSGQGDTRRVSVGVLADYVRDTLEIVPDTTVYGLTTSGTNFTVALQPSQPGKSLWARLDPSAAAGVGTFILPGIDYRADGQEILVTSTQAVSSVIFTLSGSTVIGAPTSLVTGGFFRLRYDSISNTWNRVG